MKPSEIARIAADIAEQLNKLKPEEAAKVLEVVDTLRDKPTTKKAAPTNFAPPDEPPMTRRDLERILRTRPAPSLQTYH